MTEVVAAAAMFFSVSVFLAHAFDVYRTSNQEWGAAGR